MIYLIPNHQDIDIDSGEWTEFVRLRFQMNDGRHVDRFDGHIRELFFYYLAGIQDARKEFHDQVSDLHSEVSELLSDLTEKLE